MVVYVPTTIPWAFSCGVQPFNVTETTFYDHMTHFSNKAGSMFTNNTDAFFLKL